jgi:homoserine kinase
MPRSAALLTELREAGIAAVVSGAGPTVLALTTMADRDRAVGFQRRGWTAMPLDIDRHGATAGGL